MTMSLPAMKNAVISTKEAGGKTAMYSCRLPLETIATARRVGDHMRGGTSAAIRAALGLGFPKLESSIFRKASMTKSLTTAKAAK